MKDVRYLALSIISALLLLVSPTLTLAQTLPERAYISGLVGSAQRFTLSCESRSAVDWASYWGVSIREKKFLNSLPKTDNPDTGFVGNPNAEWGNLPPYSYGVHAEPVAALLRSYGLHAEAYKGLSLDDLRAEIAAGRPVIVWVIGQMWPGTTVRYTASDGQSTAVARYEHTMILVGYDHQRVHVIDAFSGRTQSYPIKTFLTSWKVLGKMAVIGGGALASVQTPASDSENPLPTTIPLELAVHSYFPAAYKAPEAVVRENATQDVPRTYTVRRGDYLTEIARRFGLDWQRLAALNGITYPYVIHTGQILHLR